MPRCLYTTMSRIYVGYIEQWRSHLLCTTENLCDFPAIILTVRIDGEIRDSSEPSTTVPGPTKGSLHNS